jgi:AcrR family transcriptional regulator
MPARRGPARGYASSAASSSARMGASAETGARRRDASKVRSRGVVVTPRVQVAEMQRARLLTAAVMSIAELGYASASVAHITARARVSRRTFYDLFANREDCLLGILRDAVGRISDEIEAANLTGLSWRERVRGGLLVVLSFFDREPVLARVCVVQALQGGPRVLQWREDLLAELAEILDQGRGESSRSRECTVLTAEGLVGATFAIVYARLSPVSTVPAGRRPIVRDRPAPLLAALLGELMSLIVLPYQGPAAARSERHRALPSLPRAKRAAGESAQGAAIVEHDALRDVPMRLTYRTALVLEVIAEHPGASNRLVAQHADITDQGQVSKLLARLERLDLVKNTGQGQARGERNAWRLTALGEEITQRLGVRPLRSTTWLAGYQPAGRKR